jgi:hypothetical protein
VAGGAFHAVRLFVETAGASQPGGQCFDPYQCEFLERCSDRKPDDWIFYLLYLGHERYEELQALSIESIREIPDDFNLSELQARIREVLRTGKPYFGPGLGGAAPNRPIVHIVKITLTAEPTNLAGG